MSLRRLLKIILRRLYKAAVKLQIIGPTKRLLLNRLLPTELYVDFKIPKHLSIIALLSLKDLEMEYELQKLIMNLT